MLVNGGETARGEPDDVRDLLDQSTAWLLLAHDLHGFSGDVEHAEEVYVDLRLAEKRVIRPSGHKSL